MQCCPLIPNIIGANRQEFSFYSDLFLFYRFSLYRVERGLDQRMRGAGREFFFVEIFSYFMEQVGRSIEDIKIFSSRNISIGDFEIFFSCVKQVGWSIDANLANWANLAQTGFSNITLSRNIQIDDKEDLQISSKYIFDISCRWWGLDSVTCVLLNISPSHDLLIDLLPDTESVLQTTKI